MAMLSAQTAPDRDPWPTAIIISVIVLGTLMVGCILYGLG